MSELKERSSDAGTYVTDSVPVIAPKKLIEVALPLDAINEACAREKNIRHGHPSTLHLWWARRPLAAARAVIFSQMVNDPSWKWELDNPGEIPPNHLKASWAAKRKQLFGILVDLVAWENTTDEGVLGRAREEIRKSWRETCEANKNHPNAADLFDPNRLPGFHDPFAGGGALPLEAQRLGLEACASDLNPVAVLISKATIDLPARFSGLSPVNPEARSGRQCLVPRAWHGAEGLAEDIRYYGNWMREEAERRIGHLYPKVRDSGVDLTVIAWIWARTVSSPSPAHSHLHVPLVSSFILSSKKGKEAYVEPLVEGENYQFRVKTGSPPESARLGTKVAGQGANFRCLVSGAPISAQYIRAEAKAGRLAARLVAMVAEGDRRRVFLSPTPQQERAATQAVPSWKPDVAFFQGALGFRVGNYGMTKWSDLFTARQLVALGTFSDLVADGRSMVLGHALDAGMESDDLGLAANGKGATAYSEAVSVYLGFLVDQLANHCSTICGWNHPNTQMRSVFSRNALSMTWDFAEANVFSRSSGSYFNLWERQVKGFGALGIGRVGVALQADAQTQQLSHRRVVSTDPPYFDNIGYADLSDFFYAWLRHNLCAVFPDMLATIATPKSEEIVATPGRHGSRAEAERFFLEAMNRALGAVSRQAHGSMPITIYYAFKEGEATVDARGSAGWATFLEAVVKAGLAITGTWPMRTEKKGRARGNQSNALASSVVLVCRRRPEGAPSVRRRRFVRELHRVLPGAVDQMTRLGENDTQAPVAPVDLSQAIIGPGMSVFTSYSAVLEADGSPMTVRTALQLINSFLAEDDFDADTQFCLHWFEQQGWIAGQFGDADVLARAKGTAVDGVRQAGVIESGGGKVRLLRWADYPAEWDPERDMRLPIWEVLHQLIRVLKTEGETAAGRILASVATHAEAARQLAYRLYTLCERKGWAEDGRSYNELITSWSALESAAAKAAPTQRKLFEE